MGDKKDDIYRSAKEVFSVKGFKDTKVSDITARAGVAVGTFYNLYSSKEELFFEIYQDENVKLKEAILEKIDFTGVPLASVMESIAFNLEGMKTNPILKEWYNPNAFKRIEKWYRMKNTKTDFASFYGIVADFVAKWQLDGTIRSEIRPEIILALFHSVIYIDTHKDSIGLEFFPEIVQLLTEFIMKGLTPDPSA